MKKLIVSIAVIAISFASFSQVGIGTNTPNSSAALDVFSTTKGFLPPRMTAAQLATLTLTAPATGLIAYCTDCAPQGIFVFNGVSFLNLIDNTVIKPITENIVRSSTGRIWMDRNLGAKQVATASDDHLAYGGLYQWGRASDGHQIINYISAVDSDDIERNFEVTTASATSSPENQNFIKGDDWLATPDDNLWQGVNGVNNPCPSGFRIPTETEWNAEINNGGLGFWGTGIEQGNKEGAFASVLKIALGGRRSNIAGGLESAGTLTSIWTSTIRFGRVRYLLVSSTSSSVNNWFKGGGFAVRCIKD